MGTIYIEHTRYRNMEVPFKGFPKTLAYPSFNGNYTYSTNY